jgi:uncharacterized protein (TIGR03083 family)
VTGVDSARLTAYLAADVDRVRAAAVRHPGAAVPTCPGWAVADLVRHLAYGYRNVALRRLRRPAEVAVEDLSGQQPVAAFDRSYAEMTAEFARRRPDDPIPGGDAGETVGFWIRRMAHETSIHRIDAELAAGAPVAPIPEDLAVDGLDELLTGFLVDETRHWPEDYAADLTEWADRSVLVSAGGSGWSVTVHPDRVDVLRAGDRPTPGTAGATVAGPPEALLRWLYNRGGDGDVWVRGDGDHVAQLRRLLTAVLNAG